MCNRQACFDFTLNTMNNGYVRLLEAARELKAWDTPAEVARGLSAGGLPASDQTLCNWGKRGISAAGLLDACKIIGCRCEFIRSGSLPIADAKPINKFGILASRAAEIIDAMPIDEQIKVLHYLQVAREQSKRHQS